MNAGVSLYCKITKRKGRRLGQDLGMELTDGKKLLTLQVYKYLADVFLK